MKNLRWEHRLPLMAISALLAPLALAGCGDAATLDPLGELPGLEDCDETTRTMRSTLPWSAWPLPFEGVRSIPLSTWKPLQWDEFDGSIHLLGMAWNVDWMREVRVSFVDHPDTAVWNGIRWEVDSTVDIKPFLVPRGNRLLVSPFFEGRGVKPAGAPKVEVEVKLAICGPGKERIR